MRASLPTTSPPDHRQASLFEVRVGLPRGLSELMRMSDRLASSGLALGPAVAFVEELRNRARDVLLTKAIAKAERAATVKPAEDLLTLEGMDEDTAYALAEAGIASLEDLADLATDELLEKVPMDEAKASQLIMAARARQFA